MIERLKRLACVAIPVFVTVSNLPAIVLIQIDVSDPADVLFTATGAEPTRDETSQSGLSGISLVDFFTATSSGFYLLSGDFAAPDVPAFAFLDTLDVENTVSPQPGRGLNFFANSGDNMNFLTSNPAFTGSVAVDLSSVAGNLPAAGTLGDVRPGLGRMALS